MMMREAPMPFDAAFLTVMTSTLLYAPLTGVSTDGYGRAAYSTTHVHLPCRVTWKQHLVRNLEGEQEVAESLAWVRSASTLSPSGQFTLPGGSAPRLLAFEDYRDEAGALHHVTLHFSGGG
jgi:hypothetical protein